MNINSENFHIKVLQYMHGDLEYFAWSEKINRRYCERHGYEYVLVRDEPRRDRHICWHKVPVILNELCDCDYLLFLDADAVFYSHELRLEAEFLPLLEDKNVMMAQDCGNESLRWHPGCPNSGVIFMKCNESSQQIFSDWNGVSEIDEETRWSWPPEQLALWHAVLPKYKDELKIVNDYYCVQGQYGQFIRHYCTFSNEHRMANMQKLYHRLTRESEPFDSPSFSSITIMSPQPKIKIVQYLWGEENTAYLLASRINRAYCLRHGYDYVVKTHPPREDRSPHWEKIPSIREELHHCDYLLFLDADAFFYSHELTLENEIIPLLEDGKSMMMAADLACEGLRHQPDKPNSGVILIRNTPKAAEMLQVWDKSSERPELARFRFERYHEQDAFYQTVCQEFPDDFQLLKDYYLMNGFCGIHIRHLMGKSNDERVRTLERFIGENKERLDLSEERQVTKFPKKEYRWQWGIGILTTDRRTDAILARTLESFRGTGFDPPVVFTDLERKGGLWNKHRALATLLEMYPLADAYAIVEDDVLFSRDIREYLEGELWPSVGEHGGICSIFTPTMYASAKRWHTENRGSGTWMAQFRIYHPLTARKLVEDLPGFAVFLSDARQNDVVIGDWAKQNNIDIWFHNPSLVQHVTGKVTSYGINQSVNYRIGMASDFVGEQTSIREYWGKWGTEPRLKKHMPVMEIFSNSACPRKCPRCDKNPVRKKYPLFQFTPDMAKHLADKLNEYNCTVEEIAFVGGEPLLWKHWESCVDILRMTGKVMGMKMITAMVDGIDMKPYEAVFDRIGVSDYGNNRHLVEKYASNNSMYEIYGKEKHNFHPRGRIPGTIPCGCYCHNSWLFGDRVYFCPPTGSILMSDMDLKMSGEEMKSYSWSLDEFFQNIEQCHSNFGNRGICEACHVNSNVRAIVGEAAADVSDWHGEAVYEIR